MLTWPLRFPVEPSEAVREASAAAVRRNDPGTSQKAAQAVTPGLTDLERAILAQVGHFTPRSAFQIALFVDSLFPNRWDEGTIRTCVSRMGKSGRLAFSERMSRSPRGRECHTYLLP